MVGCLERWNGLHERRAPDLVYDVVRASIHQERSDPPEAIWLSWLPLVSLPPDIPITAETIWRAYVNRWPVEPGIQFCKEGLSWTRPRFHRKPLSKLEKEETASKTGNRRESPAPTPKSRVALIAPIIIHVVRHGSTNYFFCYQLIKSAFA